MKRTSGKIIALIVSVMLMVSVFAGCELFSVNVDSDMEQVVATVNVDGAAKEDIYKRELVAGYVTYGYQYVAQYGYTTSDAYELVLDNLVSNKVLVQYARQQLDASNLNSLTKAEDVKSLLNLPSAPKGSYIASKVDYATSIVGYLTEAQISEAVYNVKSALNAWVDSLDKSIENKTEEKEDETYSARTVPTVKELDGTALDEEYVEQNKALEDETEESLEESDKAAYDAYVAWKVKKFNDYKIDAATTTSRKSATKEFVDAFAELGVIGTTEYADLEKSGKQYELNNYSYYADLLASNLESFIITNYEDSIEDAAEASITDSALWNEYLETYETQKAQYSTDLTAYETALDGVTEDSYILYNPDLGDMKYGYVANILIGFSDAATSALSAYKSNNTDPAMVSAYRDTLLKTLVAKDQRASWLQSGYYEVEDKTAETKVYSFGKDYVKSGNEKLKLFKGDFVDKTDYTKTKETFKYFFKDNAWSWGDKNEEDYTAKFVEIVPTEYTFDQFMSEFFDLLEPTADASLMEGQIDAIDYAGTIANVGDKLDLIDDLLFAFNTDPGGLNNYLGYLYSPSTSATTYVAEFAEAAKLAVEKGEGTYYVVATDYGYHIIICTKVVEPSGAEVYAGGEAGFKADLNMDGTVAYRFKQAKIDANVEKMISDIVTYSISKYIDEDNKDYAVEKFEKPVSNLIEKADEE